MFTLLVTDINCFFHWGEMNTGKKYHQFYLKLIDIFALVVFRKTLISMRKLSYHKEVTEQ